MNQILSDPEFTIQYYEKKTYPSINDLGLTYAYSRLIQCNCGLGKKVISTYQCEVKDSRKLEYFLCEHCIKTNK